MLIVDFHVVDVANETVSKKSVSLSELGVSESIWNNLSQRQQDHLVQARTDIVVGCLGRSGRLPTWSG